MIVLTVTTGHSGTAYLAKVLSGCPDAFVIHEPGWTLSDGTEITDPPQDVVERWHAGNVDDLRSWFSAIRVPNMRRLLESHPHYVETGQLLSVAGMAVLLPMLDDPDGIRLVRLRRDARSTAVSLARHGCVPGLSPGGWWGLPWSPRNRLRWMDRAASRVRTWPLAATAWLWFEIEARARDLADMAPMRTWRPDGLNSASAVLDLCRWAGLAQPPARHLGRTVGFRVNGKSHLADVAESLSGASVDSSDLAWGMAMDVLRSSLIRGQRWLMDSLVDDLARIDGALRPSILRARDASPRRAGTGPAVWIPDS